MQMALRSPSITMTNLPGGGDVNQSLLLTEDLTARDTGIYDVNFFGSLNY